MRTRTLLLLAVVCGLVILVAGSLQLLRVIGDTDTPAGDLAVGDSARAGDLDVTVLDADEADGLLRVNLRLEGVDDPAGLDGFRLIVSGELLAPLTAEQAGDGACTSLTVEAQTCDLVFGTAEANGDVRVLLVRRGEDQHRWNLREG
jgi:hypothetical protein